MASIRTAIELYDSFTAPMMNIIHAVSMGVSAMENMQGVMNEPINSSIGDDITEQMNQAVQAIEEARAALSEPVTHENTGITWSSPTMPTFTNTGIERFEQEVQSANSMLEQLSGTQATIAAQAAHTSVFPANMVNDMNTMQSRIQGIQQRIQAIENNPLNMGTDRASAELEGLRSQLDQAIQAQNEMNSAMERMDVSAANSAYMRLSQTVSATERYIRDNVDEQGRFNREINEGVHSANNLMDSIKGMVAAYATVQTIGEIIGLSDTMTQTTARLDLIVDDGGSVEDLQNKIFLSAERARGSYLATADAVSKLGMQASQAFSSNDELIAFTELLNKQFVNAGTSAQGIDSVMLQLTQSMAAGVMQGEELNAIMDNASIIVQDIQRYLQEVQGIDASNIKELASEGIITAEVIKNAMFYAADETNAKFETMPKTFGQVWQSFQNTALMAFQTVLNRMNDFANSEAFNAFIMSAQEAMLVLAGIVTSIFDMMGAIGTFAYENWSIISPIIWGIIGALAIYAAYLAITKAAELASAAGKIILCVASYAHAAATGAEASATAAATAAQYGFNAALLACPITWIIILIIALIALFYAAVAAVNKFAGTSVSATGIICGVFMVAAAFIGNLFVALINFVIDIFVVLWNFIAAFANFFGNVFNDPVGAIARLFFDLVDTVLSLLQSLASAIDTIFGSNLAGAVQGWRDSLGGWVDSTFGQGEEIMAKLNAEDLHLDRFEYSSAWDAGYSFGEGIDESIANFDPSSLFDTNVPGAGDYADLSGYGSDLGGLGGIGSGVDDIAGNTGAIADSMDITEEDLKYLRDIAEQEAVNRFTTAEISVDMSGMQNNISNGMDLDGVISGLTEGVNEAIDSMAEGVHD
ncbi:tape measure protein [Pseudoflavonifractor sp. An85]|uniref:tape measure protein n=1 Tax=Pseudoflavonifractor sp. An85 TaxID=1965661 RepID=UPI000B38808E|nr:tape measure protein [Pseudoflavonifractor sp. An85]OUN22723.1 phage tail tape measure protein [Pseudoflavonifractor sp. An85]